MPLQLSPTAAALQIGNSLTTARSLGVFLFRLLAGWPHGSHLHRCRQPSEPRNKKLLEFSSCDQGRPTHPNYTPIWLAKRAEALRLEQSSLWVFGCTCGYYTPTCTNLAGHMVFSDPLGRVRAMWPPVWVPMMPETRAWLPLHVCSVEISTTI